MEPNYSYVNAAAVLVPFGAYYLGIFIRRFALPGSSGPSLMGQFLLGIPVSLVVVSPFVPILGATNLPIPGYLVTLGVIMEHGMLVHETAVSRLQKLLSSLGKTTSVAGPETTVS